MLDVNLVNTVFIGVLIVFIFIISMIALTNWADFKNAKDEISSLERAVESNKRIIGVYERAVYDVNRGSYEKQLKNKELKEEILHLENSIKVSYQACENLAKENELLKKKNEELQFEKFNRIMSEPCDNPYKDDLFKCHCGSTDFIELNRNGFNGVKGVPPYVELEIQCVKCGAIHKIKDVPISDQYLYKKST